MNRENSRPRLVKIVRDDVGGFLDGDSTVSYEPIPFDLMVAELRKKLVEEAIEYITEPSLGELADVVEVVKALAHYDLNLGPAAMVKVMREAGAKREERGGFDKGIGMYVKTTAPARHEGTHAAAE